jgi:hypothetical protein
VGNALQSFVALASVQGRVQAEHAVARLQGFCGKPKLLKLKVDLQKRRPIMRTIPTR